MKIAESLPIRKKAIVIHSGGMDSSLCLALACNEFGSQNVLSLSFSYGQRHSNELTQAKKICSDWGVDHTVLGLQCLNQITSNALMDASLMITAVANDEPNTLVVGRNGLMAHLGGIHANYLGAHCIYMGVMGLEGAHSGYRDCSRSYMDLKQTILRLDLNDPQFEIRTPLVDMTKMQTLELGFSLGILPYLLENTITCYEGIKGAGCKQCPACLLKNQGLADFLTSHPDFA